MEISLILVTREGTQREIPLKKSHVVIGRQSDCQIRLPDAGVSRQHCELLLDSGRPVLKDLGSSNGTHVNRQRISQAELSAGDVLTIGPFVFVVRIDGNPASVDTEEALEDGTLSPPSTLPASAKAAPAKGPAAASPARPPLAGSGDPDDSDEFDFDFLDEKDEPKL